MQTDQRFALNPDFATEVFEDEILLYAVATGNGVYMNKTAGLILEMCGTGQTVEEIISQLKEAFPDQQESIGRDVESAVQALQEHGALLPVNENTK